MNHQNNKMLSGPSDVNQTEHKPAQSVELVCCSHTVLVMICYAFAQRNHISRGCVGLSCRYNFDRQDCENSPIIYYYTSINNEGQF